MDNSTITTGERLSNLRAQLRQTRKLGRNTQNSETAKVCKSRERELSKEIRTLETQLPKV